MPKIICFHEHECHFFPKLFGCLTQTVNLTRYPIRAMNVNHSLIFSLTVGFKAFGIIIDVITATNIGNNLKISRLRSMH